MISLYSDSCPSSHMARIVLYFKDMDFKIIDVNIINLKQDLMLINSYNEIPVLVDDIDRNNRRNDLVLSKPHLICEYIDERFPHPQLMPIEPTEKARLRMIIEHMDRELFNYVTFLDHNLQTKDTKIKKEVESARKKIIDGLNSVANVFTINKKAEYLFGNNFSLLDAKMLPLLWRLEYYSIPLNKTLWSGLIKYAEKLFSTEEFLKSLTPAERSMRAIDNFIVPTKSTKQSRNN